MAEAILSPVETSRDTDREYKESYCPHYERSTCLLHFPCCEHDTFFPCHKCHNERIGCTPDGCEIVVEDESMDRQVEGNEGQNERRNKHHPQAKCSDADTLRCTECLEVQPVICSSCIKCHKDFAPYFCAKCRIFVNNMEMDPYHCDGCGICRANKSNHQHCYKCSLCLDKQLYKEHKCMEDSGHDMCAVCLETVFSGCCFLPCSHKLHQDCARELIQHGRFDCPICRSTIITAKKIGKCEAFVNFFKTTWRSVIHYI